MCDGTSDAPCGQERFCTVLDWKTLQFGVAGLIMFHTGLALLQAGRSRSKNAVSALMEHISALLLSIIVFWLCGFAFAFGDGNLFAGSSYFVFKDLPDSQLLPFCFHALLSAIPCSFVFGSVAERLHLTGSFLLSILIGGVVYPVSLHWFAHQQGWLYVLGVIDIGYVVPLHVYSAILALAACLFIGRRMEKFGDKHSVCISDHSVPLAFIGSVFCIIGMTGKNIALSGMTVADAQNSTSGIQENDSGFGTEVDLGHVIVNCLLSGAASGIISVILYKIGVIKQNEYELRNSTQSRVFMIQNRKWSLFAALNGVIAGLVGISGGVGLFPHWGAFVIGLVSGVLYFTAFQLVAAIRLDDTTDMIATNLLPGIWGSVVVPLLMDKVDNRGVMVGWSLVACLAVVGWALATSTVIFTFLLIIKKLRIGAKVESLGMDSVKMAEEAYGTVVSRSDLETRDTFLHFESPGLPFIFDEKKLSRRPLGVSSSRATSCTAIVSPLGPSMTSTQTNLGVQLKELSKSIPKIIVEEESGIFPGNEGLSTSGLRPPPPYKPRASESQVASCLELSAIPSPSTTAIPPAPGSPSAVPPPPPPPPSSPDSMSRSPNDVQLDVEELRVTLKEQKKRLKSTGKNTLSMDHSDSNLSIDDSGSNRVNFDVVQGVRNNSNNFNYLDPSSVNKILDSWKRRRSFDGNESSGTNGSKGAQYHSQQNLANSPQSVATPAKKLTDAAKEGAAKSDDDDPELHGSTEAPVDDLTADEKIPVEEEDQNRSDGDDNDRSDGNVHDRSQEHDLDRSDRSDDDKSDGNDHDRSDGTDHDRSERSDHGKEGRSLGRRPSTKLTISNIETDI